MLTVADFVRLDVEIQLYGSARRSNVPPCSHKSSQSACGQRVLRAPQVLHVLVADGHKPADDGRRVADAAYRQRQLRGACGARRTYRSQASVETFHGN